MAARRGGDTIRELSERELEVARLLDRHFTQVEIAERLAISPRTVKQYCEGIRNKIGVQKTREIPRVLRELGII